MLRAGILMPRSTLYPSLGIDILNGIKSFLQQHELTNQFSLLSENIGFGTDDGEIYTRAEKLILQEEVDVVIAIADNRAAEMLSPLFAATNKLLLVANFGANYSESWQPLPATIIHSLNFCLHTRLAGKLLAEGDKKAAYAISYLDGGYKLCYEFLHTHHQQGGEPCFTHVTQFQADAFTLEPLAEYLRANQEVKKLAALFSGDTAAFFYKQIAPIQKESGLHIYASPMMLDSSVKDFSNEPLQVQDVKGYTPWISELDNEENQVFKTAFEAKTGKPATIFAVLGWETGALLKEWMEQQKAGPASIASKITAMGTGNFNSPRGWLKLDTKTNNTYGPAWLVSCTGNMERTIEKGCDQIDEEWTELTSQRSATGDSSSWKNTYLCV